MNKYQKVTQVLWVILLLNIIVALTKIILGEILKLNSLTADGFHSTTDFTSNIVGLIGIKLAAKPPDQKHPYGHHKFETIAGFFIGIMLLAITIQIIYRAIMWFINPTTPSFSIVCLIILLIALIINIFVAIYEYNQGKKLNSEVLISDSIHTKSDVFISFGVILTFILIKLGVPVIIDPILSLVIAVFVFYSCLEILKTTSGILVDKKVIDEEIIKNIILDTNQSIIEVHRIRNRGRRDYLYIDLHLIVGGDTTVTAAHELSHQIQQVLEDKLQVKTELIAHIEPEEYKINRE